MSKRPSLRRVSRVRAFQALYALNFSPNHNSDKLFWIFDHCPVEDQDENEEKIREYAWTLVEGTYKHLDAIDETISQFSQHWKVKRIARIELTILRVALFEMIYLPDIPLKVAINEAVELAKEFGDENSRNFVNGILDAAAKAVEAGEYTISKDL